MNKIINLFIFILFSIFLQNSCSNNEKEKGTNYYKPPASPINPIVYHNTTVVNFEGYEAFFRRNQENIIKAKEEYQNSSAPESKRLFELAKELEKKHEETLELIGDIKKLSCSDNYDFYMALFTEKRDLDSFIKTTLEAAENYSPFHAQGEFSKEGFEISEMLFSNGFSVMRPYCKELEKLLVSTSDLSFVTKIQEKQELLNSFSGKLERLKKELEEKIDLSISQKKKMESYENFSIVNDHLIRIENILDNFNEGEKQLPHVCEIRKFVKIYFYRFQWFLLMDDISDTDKKSILSQISDLVLNKNPYQILLNEDEIKHFNEDLKKVLENMRKISNSIGMVSEGEFGMVSEGELNIKG